MDGGIRIQIGSSSSEGGNAGAPVPINDAELQAAHEACSGLLPGRIGDKMGEPGTNSVGGGPAEGPKNVEPDPAGSN
jgi:hypothetical protein